MNVPADLKYTAEHEWLRPESGTAAIGITDYAQGELGDIVFVELPKVGTAVEKGRPFGTIEAVKAVSELFAPVSGSVVEVNTALEDDPMIVNRDPYGEGWMIKVKLSRPAEIEQLLDSSRYKELVHA